MALLGGPSSANDVVLTVEHAYGVVRGEVGDAKGSILPGMLCNLAHDRKRLLHRGLITSDESLRQRLDHGNERVAELAEDGVEKAPTQIGWSSDTARRANDLVDQREPSIG